MIGTVHRDPLGATRLGALLDQLRPDAVTLELSPAALEYRQTRGALLLERLERILDRLAPATNTPRAELVSHPVIASIRTLLALPFEYQIAAAYAAAHGLPLVLLDQSEVSLRKLRRIETELISYANLKTLITLPRTPEQTHSESYAAAHALLASPVPSLRTSFLAGCRGAEGVGPRDRLLADAIRARLLGGASRQLVHIGGWVHLIDDPHGETLYSRLSVLAPRRLLLDGFQLDTP